MVGQGKRGFWRMGIILAIIAHWSVLEFLKMMCLLAGELKRDVIWFWHSKVSATNKTSSNALLSLKDSKYLHIH